MPDYFLSDDTGNDSNSGTTVALAWKTFSKALGATGIKTSDTLIVKSGYYVQAALTIAMPNPTEETFIIGDVLGDYFGVSGSVIWSGYTSAGTVNASTPNSCVILAQRNNLTFKNINFRGAGNQLVTISASGSANSRNIKFINCSFYSNTQGINISATNTATNPVFNLLIDGCVFSTKISAGLDYTVANTTAVYDYGITVQNSIFINGGITKRNAVNPPALFEYSGGLNLYNNIFYEVNGNNVVNLSNTSSEIIKTKLYNNLFVHCSASPINLTNSSMEGDFNKFANCGTLNSFYTPGPNDIVGGDPGIDFGNAMLTQSVNSGFGIPLYPTYIAGQGNANPSTSIITPTIDATGKIRPYPGSGMMTSPAIGALEMAEAYKLPTAPSQIGRSVGWSSIRPKTNN